MTRQADPTAFDQILEVVSEHGTDAMAQAGPLVVDGILVLCVLLAQGGEALGIHGAGEYDRASECRHETFERLPAGLVDARRPRR